MKLLGPYRLIMRPIHANYVLDVVVCASLCSTNFQILNVFAQFGQFR